ncbi:tRNA uracil 4-sulfurtransferase ThiI [Ferroglobus sp.]|uniref:tRNA uracil 4-sulfurtransferase ThiI n=1 Tax=Ferroglobus sp. TaxID=2614230 RepID=UPI0025C14F52|nr:tRNA uracil 4-sulfurtransferase ThiI [Ferroglobus sp.]
MIYVVHYGEIALKGKNRDFFERKLMENIKRKIEGRVRRRYGRIIVEAEDAEEKLRKIPGIKYFAKAEVCDLDIEEIKRVALKVVGEVDSFKVETKRSNKNFPLTSIEVNRVVGEFVKNSKGIKVDLKNPERTVYIEIGEKESYIYTEKIPGIGGLPCGVSGRVVAQISGGIDSPVAAFLAMKRGAEVIAAHFFNQTLHSPQVRKKILDLAEKLSEFHRVKLYMVPFEEVQREIIRVIPAKYRMIVYRRSMMRMSNIIAKKEGAKAIVTGDSLSQVASQTLDNIRVIYSASELPVLPPLIGFDKEETIEIAKRIGTYEISILPYEDCCTLMIAKHPETRAKIEDVERMERVAEFKEEDAVERAEIFEFDG